MTDGQVGCARSANQSYHTWFEITWRSLAIYSMRKRIMAKPTSSLEKCIFMVWCRWSKCSLSHQSRLAKTTDPRLRHPGKTHHSFGIWLLFGDRYHIRAHVRVCCVVLFSSPRATNSPLLERTASQRQEYSRSLPCDTSNARNYRQTELSLCILLFTSLRVICYDYFDAGLTSSTNHTMLD